MNILVLDVRKKVMIITEDRSFLTGIVGAAITHNEATFTIEEDHLVDLVALMTFLIFKKDICRFAVIQQLDISSFTSQAGEFPAS